LCEPLPETLSEQGGDALAAVHALTTFDPLTGLTDVLGGPAARASAGAIRGTRPGRSVPGFDEAGHSGPGAARAVPPYSLPVPAGAANDQRSRGAAVQGAARGGLDLPLLGLGCGPSPQRAAHAAGSAPTTGPVAAMRSAESSPGRSRLGAAAARPGRAAPPVSPRSEVPGLTLPAASPAMTLADRRRALRSAVGGSHSVGQPDPATVATRSLPTGATAVSSAAPADGPTRQMLGPTAPPRGWPVRVERDPGQQHERPGTPTAAGVSRLPGMEATAGRGFNRGTAIGEPGAGFAARCRPAVAPAGSADSERGPEPLGSMPMPHTEPRIDDDLADQLLAAAYRQGLDLT